MSKKQFRRGAAIHWDAADALLSGKIKTRKDSKQTGTSGAEAARAAMCERYGMLSGPASQEPVTPGKAYSLMMKGSGAEEARERMIDRMKKPQRRDSEEIPGGLNQTAASPEEIERAAAEKEAETVEQLVRLFKMEKLTPKEAYERFLQIGDESSMTAKQAKAYFFGHEDAAGARERMIGRLEKPGTGNGE